MGKIEIISYILNAIFLAWAVVERFLSAQDKASIKSSIRVWQNQAKGISSAVNKLAWSSKNKMAIFGSFSKKEDVGLALEALHEVTESLTQSLYETRFFTEEELKKIMKQDEDEEKRKEEKMVKKAKKVDEEK